MQMSGGHLLAAGLHGGNTLISQIPPSPNELAKYLKCTLITVFDILRQRDVEFLYIGEKFSNIHPETINMEKADRLNGNI